MNYRNLDLTLISAKGIKKASLIGSTPKLYATAHISGTPTNQKLKTHIDKDGASNPTWNFPMKFTIEESAALQNRLTLVIEINSAGTFIDKNVGVVRVPIKELLEEGVSSDQGKGQKLTSYQVKKHSGKPRGVLTFSYKFGEKFEVPVTAYQPGMAVGSSSGYAQPYEAAGRYPPPPPPGYGEYPPPPPPVGYGGYPPQYTVVQQRPRRSGLGMGLGTGLLGGLLIGDMMSGGGCGGGCGGGGCGGGGCGGGGCGGF